MKFSVILLSFAILINSQTKNEKDFFQGNGNTQTLKKLRNIEYPGDSKYDVTYYKLDITITDTPEYLTGTATITAKPTSENITSVLIDLSDSLEVNSVRMNDSEVNYAHGDYLLHVQLDREYSSSEYFTIEIDYEGRPDASYWGSFVFHDINGDPNLPAIWSLSEPYGASAWWPCKDTPADKADSSDLWITVPDNLTAVSNGILEEETDNGNGFKTFKWKSRYPIAHYLISVAISDYQLVRLFWYYEAGKNMEVVNYIFQDDITRSTFSKLEETLNMLSVFSDLFGLYPFVNEKYGHAEWRWGGAMEHQTCTTTGYFHQDIIAHELAHQWFGDKITCKDWNSIWLNEGFATYSEILYEEVKNGFASAMEKFQVDYTSALNAQGSIYVSDADASPQNPDCISNIFNGSRSYAKGSVVLHMLRGVVGDENFFNILRTYANDEQLAYDVAETADFQRVAETVSGIDLDYFFEEWIYGENYPVYYTSWNSTEASNNIYDINLNITQQINTHPAFFTMPVPVHISTELGDTVITVMNDQQLQWFTIRVSGKPLDLQVDPENWILKEIVEATDLEVGSEISREYSLSQNFPNPFNPATTISYFIPFQSAETPNNNEANSDVFTQLIIFDALGNKVETLINETQRPGQHEVKFNAGNLSSGVYYYVLKTGEFSTTKKMILLK